jgi:hypothetical protein
MEDKICRERGTPDTNENMTTDLYRQNLRKDTAAIT